MIIVKNSKKKIKILKKFNFYNKLVNNFLKNGKKNKINKIIVNSLIKASNDVIYTKLNLLKPKVKRRSIKKKYIKKKLVKRNFMQSLFLIFIKLSPAVEIKKIKQRNRSNLIPFVIDYKRRFYLASSYLRKSVLYKKKTLFNKLYLEFVSLLSKRRLCLNKNTLKPNSLKHKEDNYSKIFFSRANLHFRWQ